MVRGKKKTRGKWKANGKPSEEKNALVVGEGKSAYGSCWREKNAGEIKRAAVTVVTAVITAVVRPVLYVMCNYPERIYLQTGHTHHP